MPSAVIAATGLYTPPHSVSNAELVETFNRYVDLFNAEHAFAIEAGTTEALIHSSPEFIEKAVTEVYRVLRPGSRFLCLEFSRLEVAALIPLYEAFYERVIARGQAAKP